MTADYTAAWMPDDRPGRDNEVMAGLAAAWVAAEAREQQAVPLLVTAQLSVQEGIETLSRFARDHAATTPRGEMRTGRGANRGRGPVLGFLLNYKEFSWAARFARGSSLTLVEDRNYPLIGWAMETGALNLSTGEPTPDRRTEYQRQQLDHILSNGNNGWSRGTGADRTLQILHDLHCEEPMSADVILGTMLARGKSGSALTDLAKLIKRAKQNGDGTADDAHGSRRW
ncbi:hypothetical protein E1264_03220 [Actinomadura sp. KC216]|uniref:hypothetical protein n=1 Tax=Actinomadura sp. KC216 TaxID=2530370 RepID=UPI001047BC3C|nr:hypothetical protein [Actinomadura sp. KC216]TDB91019.1 hypothetical protein E1264_03220 [Actinomadura sp. KC216]